MGEGGQRPSAEYEKGEQFPASWGMGWRGKSCVLLWLWNVGQLGVYGVALYVRKYCAASKSSLNVHTSDEYNAVIVIVKFALTILCFIVLHLL